MCLPGAGWDTALGWPSKGMSLSRAGPSGEPLCVRVWLGAHPGAQDPLGWVVVLLLFGGIAAGTVTSDGPGPASGRKGFDTHLGVETVTEGGTWGGLQC